MFTLLRLTVFSATYVDMLVHVKEDTGHIWFFTADTRSTPVSADSSLSKYIFSFILLKRKIVCDFTDITTSQRRGLIS